LTRHHSSLDAFDDLNGATPSIFSTRSTNGLPDSAVAGDLNIELEAATSPIDERELPPRRRREAMPSFPFSMPFRHIASTSFRAYQTMPLRVVRPVPLSCRSTVRSETMRSRAT
jgi:hypothetical protein